MIRTCFCEHPVQDQLHGPKRRVMNLRKDGSWSCTACGRDHKAASEKKGK